MNRLSQAAFALAGLTVLAAPTFGDRLDPTTIPSNTRFLVHIDVSGLQKTELWKTLLAAQADAGEDPFADLREFEAEFGIDPLRDVHSLTLFGTEPDPESAVGMIVGNANIDKAIARLQQEESYVSVEVEGLRLHVVEGEDEMIYGYVHERGDRRVVLVSGNRKELVRGALVLRGAQPSMADVDEPVISLRPLKGSFLFVAATGDLPGMEGLEPASAVFDKAKSFTFDLGEAEGVLHARLAVATDSAESARNVLHILQGAVALARLAGGMESVPEEIPLDLLDGLKFGAEGKTVTAQFSYATHDLLRLAEQLGAFDH